jgi:two-component system response regulator YesN
MYSLLIADDEPKIRKGLASVLPWEDYGMNEIIFAENGRQALEQALAHKPDLCLLDICMPMMNGFEFIEELKRQSVDMVCIAISGFDEFGYVQRALRLGIFDYVLKPINVETMRGTVEKALHLIKSREHAKCLQQQVHIMLEKNMPILRAQFLSNLLDGLLSENEIEFSLTSLEIEDTGHYGFIITELSATDQVASVVRINGLPWEKKLLWYAVQNIMEECVGACGVPYSFQDKYENLCSLVMIRDVTAWEQETARLRQALCSTLDIRIGMQVMQLENISSLHIVYADWVSQTLCETSPIVRAAQTLIRQEYANQELSIRDVSERLHVSMSHLTALFRAELGLTFIEYLTRVRIQQAIRLLDDPQNRIVDIAQQVGYSSQHYFCTVFKSIMGQPPSEFRVHS